MNFSAPFILRPIATALLSLGLLLAGVVAYRFLPVAPLPSVDIPTIVVFASRPGADPLTMSNSITAPLERHLGEIAGVTELTSTSGNATAYIVVQFDINRDIDGAAHDVQAAINAATQDLPTDLPTRPYYRKFNPAEAPIMTLALTSDTVPIGTIYDAADSILAQRLSQVSGVGQVQLGGADKPAVRVQLDPAALASAHLQAEDALNAIRNANVDGALGGFDGPDHAETIGLNNQIGRAVDYRGLVLKTDGAATTRLSDVARVLDGVANTRLSASFNDKPAVLLNITKLSGANIIQTVDRVRAVLPRLESFLPAGIKLTVLDDRTVTIRASVAEVSYTMLITVALVIMVVLLFMRRAVPVIAAGVTVPLSIAGTLAAMWLEGFSLDNFSLMALTISVGFVVDDAIVMIENIMRHVERGETPLQAALSGARQIGFTVVSISVSLVAVFIPLLFLGGILGRLFHEFAMTLTLAIAVSAAVSLTLTPMLCGHLLRRDSSVEPHASRFDRAFERGFAAVLRFYARTLDWALRRRIVMLIVTIGTVVLTVHLYSIVPKGFLPTQDTGVVIGIAVAGSDVSYAAMEERQRAALDIIMRDPAVATVASNIGASGGFNTLLNRGTFNIGLKPPSERLLPIEAVLKRLRAQLDAVPGIRVGLYPAQDLRGGGRSGGNQQLALIDQNLDELRTWSGRIEEKMRSLPELVDVTSDQDRAGPQVNVVIDRLAAARLGVSVASIDNALSNAFSQRQISIIYKQRNQYWVVLEASAALQTDPSFLTRIFVTGNGATTASGQKGATTNTVVAAGLTGVGGTQVPLSAIVRVVRGTAPLGVSHQDEFPAATISFDTPEGVPISDAVAAINRAVTEMRVPASVRLDFAGNAKFFAQTLASLPLLLLAALVTIYIVLGVLYESLAQPLTIISTLPSAGVGALLALLVTGEPLSIIAIIAILLLMGIVKKNAIMMVDFALEQERHHGLAPRDAIRAACLERFRPIIMTTLAALLGALPLALGTGTGSELRQPLGVAVAGGLIVSQMLTLYTTPVVYLALQRPGRRWRAEPDPVTA